MRWAYFFFFCFSSFTSIIYHFDLWRPGTAYTTATLMPKLAATAACGFSPTLRRAVPSRYPSPLPWHLHVVSLGVALLMPSLFYIGPLMMLAPPFLYLVRPRAALVLLVVDIVLITLPTREWPWFRGVFQLW